jgi:hypothetical protein
MAESTNEFNQIEITMERHRDPKDISVRIDHMRTEPRTRFGGYRLDPETGEIVAIGRVSSNGTSEAMEKHEQ